MPPPDAVLLQNVAQGLVRFDAGGNIVAGLAERWNVSDDGLSYIFRLASTELARRTQAHRRSKSRGCSSAHLAARSQQPAQGFARRGRRHRRDDRPGASKSGSLAPRPNLLALLAQPELAILRDSDGTGPFKAAPSGGPGGELRLTREIAVGGRGSQRSARRSCSSGAAADDAIRAFAAGKSRSRARRDVRRSAATRSA